MKVFSGLLGAAAIILTACETVPSPKAHMHVDAAAGDVKIATTPALSPGMVAAANPLAAQAGIEILEQGGSAIDAAVAVQSVLGLVEPQSSGLGGGAFLIVYDSQTGEVWNYDGREAAPADIGADLFTDTDGNQLNRFQGILSGKSTGVPGAMVMLGLAHEDYGKLPWDAAFEPAIDLAENGFEVSPRLADLIAMAQNYGFGSHPAAKDYFFLEDGSPLPVGYLRDNPAYAGVLKALQKDPRALLKSPIADDIIAAVREEPLPGTLSLADMENYQPRKRPALCSTYRAYSVCGAHPPSSGGIAVMSILGTLENFDMSAKGQSADGWHTFAEASFLAYADRDKYVADDAFVEVDSAALLAKPYLAERASLIAPGRAIETVTAGNPWDVLRGDDDTPDSPGTSHFTIVDKDGLTVSMTTTVESVFGSQRMVRGFMLNNQLTDFSFSAFDEAGQPIANAPAAGKRPRSSMAPVILFGPDGELYFTSGSPGGSSIIAYTAKTIVGIVDWGLTPQEAINLPNVIARNDRIRLEENRLDEEIIVALEDMGHEIVRSEGEISGLHIILREPDGTLIGGADPRREGVALTCDACRDD